MIINLAWPRTPTAAWYDNYLVIFSIAVILVVGVIVYFIQRARGVDLSVTIHDIDESPAEAVAAEAMAAGEAGKMLDTDVVTEMTNMPLSDDPEKGGSTS